MSLLRPGDGFCYPVERRCDVEEIVCQRIMVAINRSEDAQAASRYATQLPRRMCAAPIVVGVIDASVCTDPLDLPGSSDLLDLIEQFQRDQVDGIVSEARQ